MLKGDLIRHRSCDDWVGDLSPRGGRRSPKYRLTGLPRDTLGNTGEGTKREGTRNSTVRVTVCYERGVDELLSVSRPVTSYVSGTGVPRMLDLPPVVNVSTYF